MFIPFIATRPLCHPEVTPLFCLVRRTNWFLFCSGGCPLTCRHISLSTYCVPSTRGRGSRPTIKEGEKIWHPRRACHVPSDFVTTLNQFSLCQFCGWGNGVRTLVVLTTRPLVVTLPHILLWNCHRPHRPYVCAWVSGCPRGTFAPAAFVTSGYRLVVVMGRGVPGTSGWAGVGRTPCQAQDTHPEQLPHCAHA